MHLYTSTQISFRANETSFKCLKLSLIIQESTQGKSVSKFFFN